MSEYNCDFRKKPSVYYNSDRREMMKVFPPEMKTVLEIGCAEGNFGKLLKSTFSAEVWGVEMLAEAAEKAKRVLDRVHVGNIEKGEIDLPIDYFDCIVFNDVLEHLRDPWEVLRKIKRNLKDDGYVVASIPNVRHFWNIVNLLFRSKWEYTDSGVLDKTHLRFFTSKSIGTMFKRCGFEIINLEGINGISAWKFRLLNPLLLNSLEDMRYTQFACLARKLALVENLGPEVPL